MSFAGGRIGVVADGSGNGGYEVVGSRAADDVAFFVGVRNFDEVVPLLAVEFQRFPAFAVDVVAVVTEKTVTAEEDELLFHRFGRDAPDTPQVGVFDMGYLHDTAYFQRRIAHHHPAGNGHDVEQDDCPEQGDGPCRDVAPLPPEEPYGGQDGGQEEAGDA